MDWNLALGGVTLATIICLHILGERSANRRVREAEARAAAADIDLYNRALRPFVDASSRLDSVWSNFMTGGKVREVDGRRFVDPPMPVVHEISRELEKTFLPEWFSAEAKLAIEDLKIACRDRVEGGPMWSEKEWMATTTRHHERAHDLARRMRRLLRA